MFESVRPKISRSNENAVIRTTRWYETNFRKITNMSGRILHRVIRCAISTFKSIVRNNFYGMFEA